MNAYEEKRAARIERLRARAERKDAESAAARATVDRICSVIPLGQPILVGHHSELRHRRDIARMDRAFGRSVEANREAEALRRRADAAEESTAVSSDDPDAIAKLKAKLAEEEAAHAAVLEANKRLRAGASLEEVAPLLTTWDDPLARLRIIIESMGHKTIPTTNGSANIRRIKDRIAHLERLAATPARPPETYGEVTVEEADNRVRIRFPDKPAEELRAKLKRYGFRWSPSEGAWQRHASPAAWVSARLALGQPANPERPEAQSGG